MAVGKGLDRLAHIGLHIELLKIADQNLIVGLSDKQIAALFGIGKNKIGPMIDWLEENKMVYRFGGSHGQATKQGYRNIRVYEIPVKGTGVPVKGTGSGYEIPVKGTHLIPHTPMVLHDKKKEEDDDRRRRRDQFIEENPELRALFATYRHNPSTDQLRDLDESIELWPMVVERIGIEAIVEHFDELDKSDVRPDRQRRFVAHLDRLMSRIVL